MRIILAGEFWFGSTGAGLSHGLRALGHVVDEVDVRDYFVSASSVKWKILSRLMMPRSIISYQQAILGLATRQKADLFIVVKGTYIGTRTLDRLADLGVPTVNFYPDFDFAHTGINASLIKHYSLFVSTKSYHLGWLTEQLSANRAGYIPHGYSTMVHRPASDVVSDVDFEWDISYIGNPSPEKSNWLRQIAQSQPDRKILIAGHNWGPLARDPAFAHCTFAPAITGDFYARAIQRSKINLAVHYGSRPGGIWHDSVSTRTFEIPACRGFMLHIDNEEVREFFEPDKEVATFSNAGEMNEKIDWYLNHSEERLAIAQAGYDRAVPAYSLDSRAKSLMDLVCARLSLQP